MAKQPQPQPQPNNKQQPKSNRYFDYGNVWTGPKNDPTNPGVVKARADKAKTDSVIAAYAKKAAEEKAAAIKKAPLPLHKTNSTAIDKAITHSNVTAYAKKVAAEKAATMAKSKKK